MESYINYINYLNIAACVLVTLAIGLAVLAILDWIKSYRK